MQQASHRGSHTRTDSAQTHHTTSIATNSATYTRHITTSAPRQDANTAPSCAKGTYGPESSRNGTTQAVAATTGIRLVGNGAIATTPPHRLIQNTPGRGHALPVAIQERRDNPATHSQTAARHDHASFTCQKSLHDDSTAATPLLRAPYVYPTHGHTVAARSTPRWGMYDT